MFRLIRGLVGLVVMVGLVYAAVFVPLGEKTLWQHIKAIAGSEQSQDLVREVKAKADRVLDTSKGTAEQQGPGSKPGPKTKSGASAESSAENPAGSPKDLSKGPATGGQGEGDGFTAKERQRLRELIKKKLDVRGGSREPKTTER